MINSMTAFARETLEAQWGSLTIELRGVNHRFFELSLRLPENLRQLEPYCRSELNKTIKRGKVEMSVKFKTGAQTEYNFTVNQGLLEGLAAAANDIAKSFTQTTVSTTDILQWPGVIQVQEGQLDELLEATKTVLQKTAESFVAMRRREGDGLANFLEERLLQITEQASAMVILVPELVAQQQQIIRDRFKELKIEADSQRIEQELVLLAQRMDVSEELHRLVSHVEEVKHTLSKGGVVGRRLDFLMQELNREANTLASKSMNAKLTKVAVNLKVAIEQMREQVQNIE